VTLYVKGQFDPRDRCLLRAFDWWR
jgi:hypothetical protein